MVNTRASSASASGLGTRNRGRPEQTPRPPIPNNRRGNRAPFNRPPLRCRPGSREKGRQKKSCRTRAEEVAAVGCLEALVEQHAKGIGDGLMQVGKRGATSGYAKSKRRSGSRATLNRPTGRRKRGAPDNRRRRKTRMKRIVEVAGLGEIDVTIEPLVRGMEEPQSENRAAELRTARASNCNHEDSEPVESSRSEEGWTKDQELALHNAYFLVRPSPKFWPEISKKVPGKTAKECFDKFYSAHPTPPAPRTRSQKSVTESPIRSISFSSPMSAIKSRHHLGKGKQVLLKAHQTVRHILRKQQVADGNYEADVFATVEQANPTVSSLQICLNQAASPLSAFEICSDHSESLAVTPNHSFNLISSRKGNREVLWRSMSAKKKNFAVF